MRMLRIRMLKMREREREGNLKVNCSFASHWFVGRFDYSVFARLDDDFEVERKGVLVKYSWPPGWICGDELANLWRVNG